MQLEHMTRDQLEAMVRSLHLQGTRKLSCKVSEKGCVSVYGMNSRGVHLYASQWLKVLDAAEQIREFIKLNKDELSWKDEDQKDAI